MHMFCRQMRVVLALLLLSSCAEAGQPAAPIATPTIEAITLLADVLASPSTAGENLVTAGYILVEDQNLRLVDSISFSSGVTPQALTPTQKQVWLGSSVSSKITSLLQTVGALRYALVVVRGRLEGPGVYGPHGQYHFQIREPDIKPLAPYDISISELLDHPAAYQGRLVRVRGSLLARDNSAVLVEGLSAGGLPAPKTRQLKLPVPVRDTALLDRLQDSSRGVVRFGRVEIEGFWRAGILIPIAIVPVLLS